MKVKTGFKVISYILIVLLILGILGFLIYFSNGFTTDFKSFYVVYNDTNYLKDVETIEFETGKKLRFDCKYTFGPVKKDLKGFNVSIVPNITEETNFDFTIEDKTYSYAGEKDLTSAFDLEKDEDYFILTIPENITMQSLLSNVYGGKNVEINSEIGLSNKDYFKLVVKSYNNEISITFNFHLLIDIAVEEIILDKTGIIL